MSQFQREQISLQDFKKLREAETEYKQRKLPHDYTLEIPQSASVWLLRAGIDDYTRRRFEIGYSPRLGRCIIPVRRDGVLVGSIARRLDGLEGPKYLSNVPSHTIWTASGPANPYPLSVDCVITEDVLSAIRCSRFVRSISLLGTGTSDAHIGRILAELARKDRVGIWLDPDNAGQRATPELIHALGMAGVQTKMIKSERDPKLHSDREIQEYLA